MPLQNLEELAQQMIPFPVMSDLNYWMSQYALWEAMTQNDSLGDTSAVLTAFKEIAENSRFAFLTQIESQLAHGHTDSAQLLLDSYGIDSLANTATDTSGVHMADDTAANLIVGNYPVLPTIYPLLRQYSYWRRQCAGRGIEFALPGKQRRCCIQSACTLRYDQRYA